MWDDLERWTDPWEMLRPLASTKPRAGVLTAGDDNRGMSPRALLLSRFRSAIAAVEPAAAVRSALMLRGDWLQCGHWRHQLRGRIVVIGAGKASAPMAQAVEELLGNRIERGCVVVKYGHAADLARVRLLEAGHPVPDAAGEIATREIERAVHGLAAHDLVICCLSGGASALLPAPRPPLTLGDKQETTRKLLAAGVDIHAVNTVRKHLSRLKGGRLALACAPAAVLTLAISDVSDDDLAVIGSGPTAPDPSTDADAMAIIRKCLPLDAIPPAVLAALAKPEPWTPKPGDHRLERVHHQIVASNRLALAVAARDAVLAEPLHGEARLAAERFCLHASRLPPGTCLAAGGETTVTLGEAPGLGGRNQEFALACARWIMAHDAPLTVLAASTDGSDGPTDAAGAVVDGMTWERALAAGFDPHAALNSHDAYQLLRATGDLLITGPTRTNVMDLALAWRS